jgi:hypothetical protein
MGFLDDFMRFSGDSVVVMSVQVILWCFFGGLYGDSTRFHGFPDDVPCGTVIEHGNGKSHGEWAFQLEYHLPSGKRLRTTMEKLHV